MTLLSVRSMSWRWTVQEKKRKRNAASVAGRRDLIRVGSATVALALLAAVGLALFAFSASQAYATGGQCEDLTNNGNIIAKVTSPTGSGSPDIEVIRDGVFPPVGSGDTLAQYDTFDGANTATEDWIGYSLQFSFTWEEVIFQEGIHFWDGGWFESLTVQVRQSGDWNTVTGLFISPSYPFVNNGVSYETYTLTFDPIPGDGIRIFGAPGGNAAFISVGELRVFGDCNPPPPPPRRRLRSVTTT